jgi:hypothetical protein
VQRTNSEAVLIEIIERVARAGFRRHHERKGLPASDAGWQVTGDDWREAARAMIEALREPTSAMGAAGAMEGDDEGYGYISDTCAKIVWKAMIDEALK